MKMGAVITRLLCLFIVVPLAGTVVAADQQRVSAAFASTVTQINALPGDREVPVEWKYTNHWDFPMIVAAIDGSCTCLGGDVGQINSEEVKPGATGVIRGHFTPGPHRGLLRKSLRVRFAGHDSAVELVAEVRVPSTVELSDTRIDWTNEARAEMQTLEISSGTGIPFQVIGFTGAADGQYQVEKEVVEEGMRYRIKITPGASVKSGIQTLLIRTDSADPRDRIQAVFLSMPMISESCSAPATLPEGGTRR